MLPPSLKENSPAVKDPTVCDHAHAASSGKHCACLSAFKMQLDIKHLCQSLQQWIQALLVVHVSCLLSISLMCRAVLYSS